LHLGHVTVLQGLFNTHRTWLPAAPFSGGWRVACLIEAQTQDDTSIYHDTPVPRFPLAALSVRMCTSSRPSSATDSRSDDSQEASARQTRRMQLLEPCGRHSRYESFDLAVIIPKKTSSSGLAVLRADEKEVGLHGHHSQDLCIANTGSSDLAVSRTNKKELRLCGLHYQI
jgi:hypothetical protein